MLFKRFTAYVCVFCLAAVLSLGAFASTGSTPVSASDWASVISAMTNQISVTTIVGVLASLVTAGIGLVFLWWGVRKAIGSLMSAFKKGRMSV